VDVFADAEKKQNQSTLSSFDKSPCNAVSSLALFFNFWEKP